MYLGIYGIYGDAEVVQYNQAQLKSASFIEWPQVLKTSSYHICLWSYSCTSWPDVTCINQCQYRSDSDTKEICSVITWPWLCHHSLLIVWDCNLQLHLIVGSYIGILSLCLSTGHTVVNVSAIHSISLN